MTGTESYLVETIVDVVAAITDLHSWGEKFIYSVHVPLTRGNNSTLFSSKSENMYFETTKSGSSQSTRAVRLSAPLIGLYT